mgnify:CR=1 FL=1
MIYKKIVILILFITLLTGCTNQNETIIKLIVAKDLLHIIIVSEVIEMKFLESKNIELKEKYTKSLLKTVSAFSNFHDDHIYIGINDQGKVIGLSKISEEKNEYREFNQYDNNSKAIF